MGKREILIIKMAKEFSVLMSVYYKDKASELRQSLESVVTSSVEPSEVVLVEDGELTDELELIVREYADKYRSIKIVQLPVNGGLAHALNIGLKYCTCDYIARMDSDDITLPERFEKQIGFLELHPDVDCVGTWAIEIKADGSEFFRKQMPITHEECRKFFMKRDCMIHPTVMFRRSYIEKAGNYAEDTYFGEDTMMWAQGFENGCKFANLPEYLFKFRLNDEFFRRRRGWKHAIGILTLRWRVNRMLHYPLQAYLYAIAYAGAKMMPTEILNLIYKNAR